MNTEDHLKTLDLIRRSNDALKNQLQVIAQWLEIQGDEALSAQLGQRLRKLLQMSELIAGTLECLSADITRIARHDAFPP